MVGGASAQLRLPLVGETTVMSHASPPSLSPSVLAWVGLYTVGQLSAGAQTPSPSGSSPAPQAPACVLSRVMVIDVDVVSLPAASRALAASVCSPLATEVVSQA